MIDIEQAEIGSKVVVIRHSEPVAIRSVVRTQKRFVELSDGSKWGPTGHPYPRVPYPTAHIEPATDDHRTRLQERSLQRELGEWMKINIPKLKLEELHQLKDFCVKVSGTVADHDIDSHMEKSS